MTWRASPDTPKPVSGSSEGKKQFGCLRCGVAAFLGLKSFMEACACWVGSSCSGGGGGAGGVGCVAGRVRGRDVLIRSTGGEEG